MEYSFKQVASVVVSVLVLSFVLQALFINLHGQGAHMKVETNVVYKDFEQVLSNNGNIVSSQTKPVIKKSIFHMRKGDYSSFFYGSLVQVQDYHQKDIEVKDVQIQGAIDGSKTGVNVLHYTVFDQEGNYLRYKVAVIIEGNHNSVKKISNYEEGKLV